jgi:hypothetical protein
MNPLNWKMILRSKVRTTWLLVVGICVPSMLLGQGAELLIPLQGDPRLGDAYVQVMRQSQETGLRATDTLELPFFDDFSEPFTRSRGPADLFPSQERWTGRNVYVNDHMAVNPISVGVATFDGLDSMGLAYGFGFTIPTASDTLSSRPINLLGKQDVFLSFYYQAEGQGLAPAPNDLLTLQFLDTAEVWNEVWTANGYVLADSAFKRAMLPIADEEYLHGGFRFRFINYAARAGAVDHWHVDYVYLNSGRSENDTVTRDVAAVVGTSDLLVNYRSMPWTHFKTDPAAHMGNVRYFKLRNSWTDVYPVEYNFRVFDAFGTLVSDIDSARAQVNPSILCGNEINDCGEQFAFELLGFQYPTATELTVDSNHFFIETSFEDLSDDRPENDKVLNRQNFYNYYAHDDGSAEVAYGLGNLQFPGRVAIRFDAVMRDSLRAIQYYLNPVAEDLSNEPVRFYVWRGQEVPEEIIYESEDVNFLYSTGINYMNHHFLDVPLDIEGTFFIGWQQQPVSGQKFSIGFDRSKDASDKVFYSIGTTPWTQSSIPGAVMFRPVFGRPYDWTIGVDEAVAPSFTVYPNPASGTLFISSPQADLLSDARISLFDLAGREVLHLQGYRSGIDVSGLRPGMYLLTLTDRNGHRSTQRILLQP